MAGGGGRDGAARDLIGREVELRAAREALREAGTVLLTGPGGIGRSALATALAAEAAGLGTTVLRCTPAAPERALPYVGLCDLLAGLPGGWLDALLDGLPAQRRAALGGALLRGARPAAAVDRLALGLALAELLRTLAGRAQGSGLLLVLDGLQWLDEPSAQALGFALRRTGRGCACSRPCAMVRRPSAGGRSARRRPSSRG